MKHLLEAGVHFGHQTRRWNPKMAKYIFAERNGIYIIDLQKTVRKVEESYSFLKNLVAGGGTVIFVGTKKQAQETVRVEAERCGMYYVNQRWLGGLLTNFATIKKRVQRLNSLEKMEIDGSFTGLPKKEIIKLGKERMRLEKYLAGIKHMKRVPDALFVIDSRKEKIAVNEARKLKIPVLGIVDTNCDPDDVDYIIPGNDDAIRAVKLLTMTMANAVLEGKQEAEFKLQKAQAAAEKAEEPVETEADETAAETAKEPAAGKVKEPAAKAAKKPAAGKVKESAAKAAKKPAKGKAKESVAKVVEKLVPEAPAEEPAETTAKPEDRAEKKAPEPPKDVEEKPTDEENTKTRKKTVSSTPEKSAEASKESVEPPKESAEAPKESVETPKESVETPKESAETPKESVEAPKESVETPKESGELEESKEAEKES